MGQVLERYHRRSRSTRLAFFSHRFPCREDADLLGQGDRIDMRGGNDAAVLIHNVIVPQVSTPPLTPKLL
jgi:hypothetical protein